MSRGLEVKRDENMKVLIACEESQEVCKAFRAKGHEAYSCDILECSGGHPEWHLLGNVIDYLYPLPQWDLIIAHPPCTYLCNSGVRWLYPKEGNERWNKMREASDFFNIFCNIHWASGRQTKVAIENPVQHKHCDLPRHTQVIKPSWFGHLEQKQTCLWLFGLPALQKTNDVTDEMMKLPYAQRAKIHYASPGKDRAKLRSKTYPGIAAAMAEQWGGIISLSENSKIKPAHI